MEKQYRVTVTWSKYGNTTERTFGKQGVMAGFIKRAKTRDSDCKIVVIEV